MKGVSVAHPPYVGEQTQSYRCCFPVNPPLSPAPRGTSLSLVPAAREVQEVIDVVPPGLWGVGREGGEAQQKGGAA